MNQMVSPANWQFPPATSGQCGCGCGGFCSFCFQDFLAKQITAVINNPASGVLDNIVLALSQYGKPIPLVGVQDGSVANAGMVGQFITMTVGGAITGAGGQTANVATGVLPPGDWDVQTTLSFDCITNGGYFYQSPFPTGFLSAMEGIELVGPSPANPGDIEESYVTHIVSERAGASLAVPTLITFFVVINPFGANTGTGNYTMQTTARRMR